MRKYYQISCACWLLAVSPFSVAQPSNTTINASFTVESIAHISGLEDIIFATVDPFNFKPPLEKFGDNVCLESSTGQVQLSVTSNTPIDRQSQTALLSDSSNQNHVSFQLFLNDINLFTDDTQQLIFTADSNFDDCHSIGSYPLKASILRLANSPGTYSATLNLLVIPVAIS